MIYDVQRYNHKLPEAHVILRGLYRNEQMYQVLRKGIGSLQNKLPLIEYAAAMRSKF